jgi:hypothetical protein
VRVAAALAVLALAGCGRPAAPIAATTPPPAASATTTTTPAPDDAGMQPDAAHDAGAPEAAAAPARAAPRWITFDGPPYVEETPMHGGPPWSFTSKLPARLQPSGTLLIPFVRERGLGSVPNLAVRFVSRDGAHVERTVELLSEGEFDRALPGDDAQKRAAFVALGDTVRARILALDAELDAHGADLVPLEACTVDPPNPYAGSPPCGAVQSIACGGVVFHYLGGRQALETPHGRRAFPAWRKAGVLSSDTGAGVPVNECVGEAWHDPEGKALVLTMVNLCSVAGDWCWVQSDWRVVRGE